MNNHAIVVDDDQHTASTLSRIVKSHGFSVDTADSIEGARNLYTKKKPNLMLIDVMLPDGNGIELIEELQKDDSVKFVVITGHASIKVAVQALKLHVFDFLEKPVELQEIRKVLQNVSSTYSNNPNIKNKVHLNEQVAPKLLGQSTAIKKLRSIIKQVSKTRASIFLQGDSGTGKEVVAQHIHLESKRTGNFIAVNCGSVTKELAASEFFGHEKGSFTGANSRHIGHFERANGGTIFLDEITEMPLDIQVNLLRVLETSRIHRLGGKEEINIDIRVIAATNRNLKDAINEGKLREDLYFRLAEFPITIPPLKERDNDIQIIADDYLETLNREHHTNKIFSEETKNSLMNYPWPGNVRELKNVIHRAFLLSGNVLDWKTIFSQNSQNIHDSDSTPDLSNLIGKSFWEIEKDLIYATLAHHNGDKEQTSKTLGISLKTLYNRLHAYS